jgi:uncharacterized protein with GYD domain
METRTVRSRPEIHFCLFKRFGAMSEDLHLLIIVESSSGDNVAKFSLATASLGNVRTSTTKAWSEAEFTNLISELP